MAGRRPVAMEARTNTGATSGIVWIPRVSMLSPPTVAPAAKPAWASRTPMLVAVSRSRGLGGAGAGEQDGLLVGQRRGGVGWFGSPLDSAGVGVHYFANDKTIGHPP